MSKSSLFPFLAPKTQSSRSIVEVGGVDNSEGAAENHWHSARFRIA